VIVEGKIEFDFEITLLTVRARNAEGEIQTHFCDPIGHRQEAGDYRESWQPQAMSDTALATAQDIARKVTTAIGGLGLFGVEFFVKGDQVWFSEVSPRPHDTGMVTLITQRQSEFDLHVRAILGLPVCTTAQHAGASAVVLAEIEKDVVSYKGLEKALSVFQTEVRLFAKPQARLSRRMGVALSVADDVAQARLNATKAASLIEIQ
jgi:phosphoribosylglycinamide formyltransferase 2